MNPKPQIGDIWCFSNLGAKFYYLVLDYNEHDPDKWDADSVTLLSFTSFEYPTIKEGVSRIMADSKRWRFIS